MMARIIVCASNTIGASRAFTDWVLDVGSVLCLHAALYVPTLSMSLVKQPSFAVTFYTYGAMHALNVFLLCWCMQGFYDCVGLQSKNS